MAQCVRGEQKKKNCGAEPRPRSVERPVLSWEPRTRSQGTASIPKLEKERQLYKFRPQGKTESGPDQTTRGICKWSWRKPPSRQDPKEQGVTSTPKRCKMNETAGSRVMRVQDKASIITRVYTAGTPPPRSRRTNEVLSSANRSPRKRAKRQR